MFEETNQQVEGFEAEALPENLFEDEEHESEFTQEENSGSESEGSEAEERANGENHAGESSNEDGATIRIKYNGEERDLSLSEARTLAQKGMNYDHVVQERDRNRSAFDFLMERAKGEGITVEQLIEQERGRAENQRLEAKMSELRERDDDATEETLKKLAKFELEAERTRIEREKEIEAENKKNTEIEGWKKLFTKHPELISAEGGANVTQAVRDLVTAGHSPTEAYYIERARELEEKNKILSDADAAKKKSVGSLSGFQSSEEDDFLAGFEM